MRDHAAADAEPFCLDVTLSKGRDERTRLARRRVSFPWSLGRAFAAGSTEGPATLIPQAAAAGLIPGDAHYQRIRVETGASARLVAAGATTVYAPHLLNRAPSRTHWLFEIAPEAALVNEAEPYVLRGPARLCAHQTVVIAESGRLVTWDGVVFGEGSDGGAWTTGFTVRRPSGETVLADAQRAEPGSFAQQRRLSPGWSAFASIYALGPPSRLPDLTRAIASAGYAPQTGVYAASAILRGGSGVGVRLAAYDGGLLRVASQSFAKRLSGALDL